MKNKILNILFFILLSFISSINYINANNIEDIIEKENKIIEEENKIIEEEIIEEENKIIEEKIIEEENKETNYPKLDEENKQEEVNKKEIQTPLNYFRDKLEQNLEDEADIKQLKNETNRIEKENLNKEIEQSLLNELNDIFNNKVSNNNEVLKSLIQDNEKLVEEKINLDNSNNILKKEIEDKIEENNILIEEIELITKKYKENISKNNVNIEQLDSEIIKNNILLDKVTLLQKKIEDGKKEAENKIFNEIVILNLLVFIPWIIIYLLINVFIKEDDINKKRFLIKSHIFFSTILLIFFIGSILYLRKEEGLIIMLLMLGGLVITFRPIILSFFYSTSIIGKYNIGDIIDFNGNIGIVKKITSLYTYIILYDENKKPTKDEVFYMHQDTIGKKIKIINKKDFFNSNDELTFEIKNDVLDNDKIVSLVEKLETNFSKKEHIDNFNINIEIKKDFYLLIISYEYKTFFIKDISKFKKEITNFILKVTIKEDIEKTNEKI